MADSVFMECLEKIAADIVALSLAGVLTSQIEVLSTPWDDVSIHTGITIHPAREDIRNVGGTCQRDDIGYGCQVTMVDPNLGSHRDKIDQPAFWAQKIRSKFINQRLTLPGAVDVYACRIERPRPILPKKLMQRFNYTVQALVVRCWTRESRG